MRQNQQHSDLPVLEMADAAVASLHAPELILVEHVDWTVDAGDFWVIAGVPASGKTDLLATAAGLMRPHRGAVRLFGKNLTELHEEERLQTQLRVGVVFGYGGRLFNHLSVAENLALPLCYHHNYDLAASEQRVQTVLAMMELAALAHTMPVATSRNLRQRVALARALVLSPELLLLDNPLVGIDPRESRWWMEFLEALLAGHPLLEGRHLTVVVGTDDIQPWGGRGHLFALLDQKRLQRIGNRDDLLKSNIPALRELMPAGWLKK